MYQLSHVFEKYDDGKIKIRGSVFPLTMAWMFVFVLDIQSFITFLCNFFLAKNSDLRVLIRNKDQTKTIKYVTLAKINLKYYQMPNF